VDWIRLKKKVKKLDVHEILMKKPIKLIIAEELKKSLIILFIFINPSCLIIKTLENLFC
jgi:hypothetical protein